MSKENLTEEIIIFIHLLGHLTIETTYFFHGLLSRPGQ
jgi:hypothetical protein